MITGTVNAWAISLGKEARTVLRALACEGVILKKAQKVSAKQIVDALFGDEYQQRVKNLEMDAKRKEREEREANGELVQKSLVEKQIAEYFTLPLTQALASLPSTLDSQCNPNDPELARAALLRWVEETKRQIRNGLPK